MIRVTEQWSEEQLSKRPPWTARRVFVVTGVADSEAALAAVDTTDPTAKIPQLNAPHKAGSPLVCTGPQLIERGLNRYKVGCDYRIVPGGQIADTVSDPLLQPPRYRWEPCLEMMPADHDVMGRPLVNAADYPLEPMPRPVKFWLLHVWRNEPEFDVAKAEAYANKVNSHAMTVAGRPVAAEHMLCEDMTPEGEYVPASPYARMHYSFRILFGDVLGPYPFQHRVMNAGDSGWYLSGLTPQPAKFTNEEGDAIHEATRLDLDGLPYKTTLKAGGRDVTTPPSPIAFYKSEVNAAGTASFLYYQKHFLADLRDLGL